MRQVTFSGYGDYAGPRLAIYSGYGQTAPFGKLGTVAALALMFGGTYAAGYQRDWRWLMGIPAGIFVITRSNWAA